jgi:hypothetical protein
MTTTLLFSKLSLPKPTVVFKTYWEFACERQKVFFRRLEGTPYPWTHDEIIANNRFTNVYRILDRVSQFLISEIIYRGREEPEEVFFRTLLFKIFNRIDTWTALSESVGEISWQKYDFATYDAILTDSLTRKDRIFSAAYIMPSGITVFGHPRKHRNYLLLLQRMLAEDVPSRLAKSPTMEAAFSLLRAYPLIGDFLAYQYVIDLNYSNLLNFSEMDFVVPGPGAQGGLKKCFSSLGDLSPADCIRWIADTQECRCKEFGFEFQNLSGRALQLIDCQNLLCEVDKYARVRHPEFNDVDRRQRSRIKQRFRPDQKKIVYRFPPKWNLAPLHLGLTKGER